MATLNGSAIFNGMGRFTAPYVAGSDADQWLDTHGSWGGTVGISAPPLPVPYGLAIKAWAGPDFWTVIGQRATDYPTLTVGSALHNIFVSTIGNLLGGSLMVGAVYWFVYLRRQD
jgi:hypothetical protein